jgi:flagellar biosynthesis/type III secretory pathway protein FliH
MSRVIKSEDNPCSVRTIEYIPFDDLHQQDTEIREKISSQSATQYPRHPSVRGERPDIQQQMDKLMSEAKDKAEHIIQKAQFEAVDIKDKAFRSGYEAGQEATIKEVQEVVDSISRAFRSGLEDIASLKDSILSQAEGDIVQLTIAIARKLLFRELEQHPDTVVAIVKEALKAARNAKEITVKIHPDDHIILKQYANELMAYLSRNNTWTQNAASMQASIASASTEREALGVGDPTGSVPIRVEEDPTVSPGGCIVETDTTLVDMSLEARIDSIMIAMSNAEAED